MISAGFAHKRGFSEEELADFWSECLLTALRRRSLNKAIAADPAYAPAWIKLAWAHSMAANCGADGEDSNRAAMEAAERAVLLDPKDAEAHAVLGDVLASRGEVARGAAIQRQRLISAR